MSDDLTFPDPPSTKDPTSLHIYGCLKVIDMKVDRLEGRVGSVEGKAKVLMAEREQVKGAVRLAKILGATGLVSGMLAAWHFVTGQTPHGTP